MCGRYASFRRVQALEDAFRIAEVAQDARLLPESWNVAPTDPVRMVVERADRETGEINRQLQAARWGLVPSWAKDPSIGNRMINARAETLLDKGSYRKAFAQRRALLPADGYYEWKRPGPGALTKAKQPFYIHPADDGPLALAGLYEFWRDPAKAADDPSRWLVTTTVITTDASEPLAHIHDRQPLMLRPEAWDAWLDPAVGADDAADLLRAPAPTLVATEVSTRVNKVGNNGPELIEPEEPAAPEA